MRRAVAGVFSPVPPAPLPYPAEVIVRALAPCALEARVARIEQAVANRVSSLVAVVDSLADPHNAAAILRTCDGLGIGEVHAIEREIDVLLTTRVTKGCEKWMDLRRHGDADACVDELQRRGFTVLAADMDGALGLADIAKVPRAALVFGNEHTGVSRAMRARCDGAFAVPMYGMVESFNVSVAAAIALFAARTGRAGDLGSDAATALKARFLMESVQQSEWIVERYVREHGAGV